MITMPCTHLVQGIPACPRPGGGLLVIVVAVIALLAGLAANRCLRPRLLNEDDDTGMAAKTSSHPCSP
ncbi:hypothetical protein [Streptomyces sp. TLI_146]|uniref:hypothetical protein n=1 Tax=Streptomyces sp. TLI_146 TaxID=1938858 RepID=UPI000CBE8DEE|nr:hypothetical protein [Streptomyces sp. TLI_146]PKV83173.1 hypothetical protein BX283_0668 [Streptomyces sp. TLI_146]